MKPLVVFALLLAGVAPAAAAPAAHADEMPVREVTVFKDGHAFVLRQGEMEVGASGNVTLEALPAPVLGTFWPFAEQPGASLTAVKAGSQRVKVERTALELVDLLAANVGAGVIVTDVHDRTFRARIAGLPTRSSEELAETAAPGAPEMLPQRGTLVLLETDDGLKAMPLTDIRDVVFKDGAVRKAASEEMRHRLTLELAWQATAAPKANVGMLYLQKGLRWIPSYRVDLGADGTARVRLQGTLVNDLTDLDDVGVNLVIGVPTFAFSHMTDPISMQAAVAQVVHAVPQQAITGQYLSNAIMTQAGMQGGRPGGAAAAQPTEATGARSEDLYVFHVAHVTLAKGERLVVPVAEVTIPYENVYTLNLPFSPPPDAWPSITQRMHQNPQEAEAARLMLAPKVRHEVRLTNEGPHPLTTAPALVLKEGRVLAQGMLTYTSVGSKVDLPVTTAIDVKAKKSDQEVERAPDFVTWHGDRFARVDMKGSVKLTNYKKETIHVEVLRYVLGANPAANHGGAVRVLNALEDSTWSAWTPPRWWRWYNWPHWWYHFNGVAEIRWELTLEPGETDELGYTWSYFWN